MFSVLVYYQPAKEDYVYISETSMADSDDKQQLLATLSEILNVDQELARYYLEKTRWSVEAAINEYYADTADVPVESNLASKPPSYAKSEEETSKGSQSDSSHHLKDNSPTNDSSNLKLLCWNIDGIDVENIEERTVAALETIRAMKPDVVILQEVIAYSLNVLQKSCEGLGYTVLFGDYTIDYFNAILLRKSTVETNGSALQFVAFPNSTAGRHYLAQPIKFADAKIIVMTSHLESPQRRSDERKNQLKEILGYMKKQNQNFNVVFGGDTNLYDHEVAAIGGLPSDILDAWECCGSSPTTKETWDLCANDNHYEIDGLCNVKFRLDRIFLRVAENLGEKKLVPSSFMLVGKERLKSCGRFASDHWAIWLEMSVQ